MSEKMRESIVVALTGGIACGKSEVGRILGEEGFVVCDADRVAHGLMVRGTPIYQRIVEEFGREILAGDIEISRPLLGKIVFGDPEKRLRLDRLVHPAVRGFLSDWIVGRRMRSELAVVQIPLLFESGMQSLDFDAVVCVSCDEDLVVRRLGERGLGPEESRLRIASQMPLAEKERLSDYVIRNRGTLEELKQATREFVGWLLR